MLLAHPRAGALLNIDGTRNQVFVFGNVSFAYDSNIFAQSGGGGDTTASATLGLELKRRAGIITVNGRAQLDRQQFTKNSDQNSWNPTFYLELDKTTGRTTGSFTINAYRSARADSAVNLRTTSWNFPLGLQLKYPINDKLYVTSQSSYLQRRYSNGSGLSNYRDYGEGIDLFYVYTSKLDLFSGYRIRVSDTDKGSTTDHNFNLGASGGLFSKVNGVARVGYQFRTVDATRDEFQQVSAAIALTWNATRKLVATSQISRDFTTTAVGGSVDALAATLRGTYTFTRRFQMEAGVGYGRNIFLGGDRRDDFFSWDVGASYSWNEHLKLSGSYNYLHNWSSVSFSDFQRHSFSFDIASRF